MMTKIGIKVEISSFIESGMRLPSCTRRPPKVGNEVTTTDNLHHQDNSSPLAMVTSGPRDLEHHKVLVERLKWRVPMDICKWVWIRADFLWQIENKPHLSNAKAIEWTLSFSRWALTNQDCTELTMGCVFDA